MRHRHEDNQKNYCAELLGSPCYTECNVGILVSMCSVAPCLWSRYHDDTDT